MRLLLVFVVAAAGWAQPQMPNLEVQREAIRKLEFLVGTWTGVANVIEGPKTIKVNQTEQVTFKLDGLVLLIEGTGRDDNGKIIFGALATVAYDEAAKKYVFRAHSSGRYLETELKVPERGFEWGFTAGPAKIRNVMSLNEKGEWVETTEVAIGDAPARRTMNMLVRRVQP